MEALKKSFVHIVKQWTRLNRKIMLTSNASIEITNVEGRASSEEASESNYEIKMVSSVWKTTFQHVPRSSSFPKCHSSICIIANVNLNELPISAHSGFTFSQVQNDSRSF